jgi:hypothetical protein
MRDRGDLRQTFGFSDIMARGVNREQRALRTLKYLFVINNSEGRPK